MIYSYKGHYSYTRQVISQWNNTQIGVYYCGYLLPNGNLFPLYIGRATGQMGIRGRLLQHLDNDEWSDVVHFGYTVCDSVKEAEDFEAQEIRAFNPKYNTQNTW